MFYFLYIHFCLHKNRRKEAFKKLCLVKDMRPVKENVVCREAGCLSWQTDTRSKLFAANGQLSTDMIMVFIFQYIPHLTPHSALLHGLFSFFNTINVKLHGKPCFLLPWTWVTMIIHKPYELYLTFCFSYSCSIHMLPHGLIMVQNSTKFVNRWAWPTSYPLFLWMQNYFF